MTLMNMSVRLPQTPISAPKIGHKEHYQFNQFNFAHKCYTNWDLMMVSRE